MAMPSMSRPRSGHDMDILKSILGSSSDHSTIGDKSTTKTHSRTDSASSSLSSLSLSHAKTGSLNKSGQESDSSCSDSESRTESQRDRSSSVDEKPQPLKERKNTRRNRPNSVKSGEQTKNCKNSGMESVENSNLKLDDESISEIRNKKQINRRRKLHLKRQKKVESAKECCDNKDLNSFKNMPVNGGEPVENKQDEQCKHNKNSLHNSNSSLVEEHVKKHNKLTETKKQQKHQHLSKRAQKTLNLYPERYGDPERLKHNYEELQEILQSQFIEDQHPANDELVKETKHVLGMYQHHQSGYTGLLRPPPGIPAAGRRVRRIRSAARERSPAWTQTDLTGEPDKIRPQSAKGYYLIDTTKADQCKRVTFVQLEDGEEEETVDAKEDQHGHSTYTVSIQLDQSKCQSSSEPERGRVIKKITRRPKSASNAIDKKKPASRSLSPRLSPSRKPTQRMTSESSTSRSRSSDSRSPSTDRRQTDNHLENTGNAKIQEWLKQKKRLLRQQKREEKRLRREKRKQEAEESKIKMAKHEKAEVLYRRWVEQKEKEARLLKRRKRKHKQDLNCSTTTISSDVETMDLKNGEMVNDGIMRKVKEQGSRVHTVEKSAKLKTPSAKYNRKIDVNMSGQEGLKCTCGFTESVQSMGTEIKLMQHTKKDKKAPPKLKKSGAEPASTKGKTSDDENSEEKRRLSYDDWLKQKRSEDMEKRKEEKKQQEEILAQSDPEMDSIVSGMAKRRVQNILKGKKQIHTSIKSVDDEANLTMDEKVLGKHKINGRAEEVAPSSGSSARFYRWVPKEDNNNTEGGAHKRPVSAHVRSSRKRIVAKGKRPASAKVTTASLDTEETIAETSVQSSENQRTLSPKPKVPLTKAYKDVKYQRQSWDEFSDYVWDKLNEDGEDENHHHEPEKHQTTKSEEKETNVNEEPKIQSMFETKDCSSNDDHIEQQKSDESEKADPDKDEQVDKREVPDKDLTSGREAKDSRDEELPEVDHDPEDKHRSISLTSNSDVADDTDQDQDEETDEVRQTLEKQCISEVVEETIFSMTEIDGKSDKCSPESDFPNNIRRPSIALENIPEEVDEDVEPNKEEIERGSSSGEQTISESCSTAEEEPKQEMDEGTDAQSNQEDTKQEVDGDEQQKQETGMTEGNIGSCQETVKDAGKPEDSPTNVMDTMN
ncbi:hypothetical protein LSH36_294g03018 [Paralvinella palmiformis]|uniref:Uncharacterized protein n=1 Tax=Paralvinella palmiformis TaxID=53620 RepID=A0AAD9JHZ5_9ANNE|nr:hypothetical protein LSH36_294g03018 [Paralvinella palmiformis]